MASTRRRLLTLLGATAAASAWLIVSSSPVLADAPTLSSVAPQVVVLNGQPLHVTLIGSGLTGVISVTLVPAVQGVSFAVANDATVLLTLPPSTPADTYSVFVTANGGLSDPSDGPSFAVTTAISTFSAAPPPAPRYSFAPMPQERYEPTTGVLPAGTTVRHAAPPPPGTLNPLLLLPLGIVLGGVGYLLWGRPGRLAAADRQGLAAHLVGRPAQALGIGRICLQCGRLHFFLGTRRDLWRAGRFCSATCFVAAQEDDSAARAGESTAETRMREMFVYSELEQSLQAALAGDVHALEHAAAVGDPHIEAVLAPNS